MIPKLKTKLTITDVEGNSSEDSLTIEERVKDNLDSKLEGEIYVAKLEKDNEENLTIHEKMYRIATAKYNPFAVGGSESIHDFE